MPWPGITAAAGKFIVSYRGVPQISAGFPFSAVRDRTGDKPKSMIQKRLFGWHVESVLDRDLHNRLSTSRHFPVSAGVFFPGLGLGGFLRMASCCIQVLQWHHMLSNWFPVNTIENLEVNTRSKSSSDRLHRATRAHCSLKSSKSLVAGHTGTNDLLARRLYVCVRKDPIGRWRLPLASPGFWPTQRLAASLILPF